MAQHDYNIANATFPATRSDINSVLSAINTSNSGTSRPSSAVEGTVWLDTTNATTPTLKFYDGSDDISLATLDYTANTVNWIDSTVVFDIVNDLSPQLGGNLDLNSNDITGTGDINITGSVTATSFSGDGSALTGIESGITWQSSIKTSSFTAVANEGYWIDTSSNTVTITFPSSASVGDTIELVDYARTWGTNKIIIDSNGLNYQGDDDTFNVEYDTSGQALRVVYSGATKGWIPTSDEVSEDNPIEQYSVDYLVVAGAGGGGSAGGGGGAGGLLDNSQTVIGSTGYTVTVGAGGAGGGAGANRGGSGAGTVASSGSNSVFASNTANAGGAGASEVGAGSTGGSGGGGTMSNSSLESGLAGTAGQGNAGGTANSSAATDSGAGGGGGSSATGGNGSASVGGNGGAGTDWKSLGTSYAGGGGGGFRGTGTAGSGGAGGGGAGASSGTPATSGTANTGGGGGGGGHLNGPSNQGAGGTGGSGIVIIRYSGSQRGTGGTVTSVGGYTYHTFTSSGTYTA